MGFDSIDRQYRRREVATSGLAAAAAAVGLLGTAPLPRVALPGQVVRRLGETWELVLADWGTLTLRAVGSRCTCDPPPTGTDQDWLAQAPASLSHRGRLLQQLDVTGWMVGAQEGRDGYPDEFVSLRRGEDNLILALDPNFHDRFMVASHLARRLNLLEKADRVALFQAVLYGRGEGA